MVKRQWNLVSLALLLAAILMWGFCSVFRSWRREEGFVENIGFGLEENTRIGLEDFPFSSLVLLPITERTLLSMLMSWWSGLSVSSSWRSLMLLVEWSLATSLGSMCIIPISQLIVIASVLNHWRQGNAAVIVRLIVVVVVSMPGS